jgi:hypothetical protein
MREAERLDHVVLDQVLPFRAVHLLDDRAREACAIVGVRRDLAGLAHALRPVTREEVIERQEVLGLRGEQHAEHAILETRRMRHQIAHADRLIEAVVRNF